MQAWEVLLKVIQGTIKGNLIPAGMNMTGLSPFSSIIIV